MIAQASNSAIGFYERLGFRAVEIKSIKPRMLVKGEHPVHAGQKLPKHTMLQRAIADPHLEQLYFFSKLIEDNLNNRAEVQSNQPSHAHAVAGDALEFHG